MKILLSLLGVLVQIAAFGQTYELIGTIKDLDSDSLLLIKIRDEFELVKIPVDNGTFNYQESIQEPFYIQLMMIDKKTNAANKKLTEFMVEEGTIYVKGNAADYDSIQISGSASDRVLKAYFAEDELLVKKWEELKVSYDEFKAVGDTISRKKTASLLNEITFNERVPLLKKYVFDYRDQIIGALLPNFCTLEQVLKKEDYLDMYNTLTPEIQQTAYGQSVKERSLE